MSLSHFERVPKADPDPIFFLNSAYQADTFSQKVNLGVGAYRDDNGKPWVLPAVKKAEYRIVEDYSLNHEYLPITGLASFTEASVRFMFGEDHPIVKSKCYAAVQAISGTGAIRFGAEFLAKFHKAAPVYISKPTWANHRNIFIEAGISVAEYRYWNPSSNDLDFEGMIEDFKNAPTGSIILLHACAHNPTGVDPTQEQWKLIADVIERKNHIAFFDSAYQGFASGDLDRDAFACRYFASRGMEFILAQSYSKNFGLYNERCGCLSVVTQKPETAVNLKSQLAKVARPMISNPPAFGARIVDTVLNDKDLFAEWKQNLMTMANRINETRRSLRNALERLGTPGTWNHITDQIGMFSFTGLAKDQVKCMKERFHIYLTDNGRISMAGLNSSNVNYVAEAIDYSVRNVKASL